MKIKFNDFLAVNEFVKITNKYESDIDIHSGRFIVDGKSLMALYSLDLSRELEVNMNEVVEGNKEKFISEIREIGIVVE